MIGQKDHYDTDLCTSDTALIVTKGLSMIEKTFVHITSSTPMQSQIDFPVLLPLSR